MSVLKKLAGETVLYGVSSILGRLVYYLLVMLHTKIFLPHEMAITVNFYAWVGVLNVLYTYGMETAYFRFSSNSDEPKKYYNLILSAILVSSFAFSGLIILFAKPLAGWLGYPENIYAGSQKYIIWLAIIMAIDAIVAIPFARLRREKQAKRFAFTRFFNILLNVALNIIFLVVFRDIFAGKYLTVFQPIIQKIYSPENAVGYIFLANLIANAVMLLQMLDLFRDFKFQFDKQEFKIIWVYAYPILIMGLAGTVNNLTDRLVLEHFLPAGFYPNRSAKDALGIYGNCVKLAIFMNLAVQAFRYAADPFFFSKAEDKNAPKLFAEVMKWFIIVCVIIWLTVSLNLDTIGNLLLKRKIYLEGIAVVPVLLLANLFLGIYYNLTVWFKLTDKTYFGTMLTFVGAVVTIIANYFLIPVMGYMGCAVAFLISTIVMASACYLLGEKYYSIPYHLKSAGFYILSAGVLIYLFDKIKVHHFWLSLVYHGVVLLCYFGIIAVLERKTLKLEKYFN